MHKDTPLVRPAIRPITRTHRWTATFLIFFLWLAVFSLHAQFETASVLGYVRDSTGATVPNSKVQLINTATGVAVTATTDSQGQYQFSDIHIGQYNISATVTVSTQP